MRFAPYLVLLAGFLGCRHSTEHTPPWNEPVAWSPGASTAHEKRAAKPLPEFAEDALSEQQRVALEEVRRIPATVVMPSKFKDFPSKREIFTNWFFRGYTFTKATGWRHHHHSLHQNVTPDRRPVIEGWLDGQLQAEIEKIKSASESMPANLESGSQQQDQPDGAANGSQPIRAETNRTSSAAGSRR